LKGGGGIRRGFQDNWRITEKWGKKPGRIGRNIVHDKGEKHKRNFHYTTVQRANISKKGKRKIAKSYTPFSYGRREGSRGEEETDEATRKKSTKGRGDSLIPVVREERSTSQSDPNDANSR